MRKEPQIMPRHYGPGHYGPGHFTEDPYSQVVSPHGIPVDDLVSVLQKEIRRGRIDNEVPVRARTREMSAARCIPALAV